MVQHQRLVYSFACPSFKGIGTPLIFSRRGDGGEVFEVKNLPYLKRASRNQFKNQA